MSVSRAFRHVVPPLVRLKHAFLHAWGAFRGSYSQSGQDRWVLSELMGKRDGFFLDIGAFDGKSFSNTYLLEKKFGWHGICVEPSDASFRRLQKTRTCICDHSLLWKEETDVEFIDAGEYGGVASELSEPYLRLMERCLGVSRSSRIPVKRRTSTVADVLRRHAAPACIDYLSIDTQGSEYEILQGFPFAVHHVRTLTVEHWNQREKRDKIRTLLTRNGYVLAKAVAYEDWYRHASAA